MDKILNIIEKETSGKSFKSHRYCYDSVESSGVDYDDNLVTWKRYGETIQHNRPIDLLSKSKTIAKFDEQIFAYFLDGSRHTYKVDDMSYNNGVYPIVAGQIGIGCCRRTEKVMFSEAFRREILLVLPDIAHRDGWRSDAFFSSLLKKVNENVRGRSGNKVLDNILTYSRSAQDSEKLEKKAIAVIQDRMTELEKEMVASLVSLNKLGPKKYLIKDGSLEYKIMSKGTNKELKNIASNYRWVIGVSKSFNPAQCCDRNGRCNSSIVADLKPYHRTPAYLYKSDIVGDVLFAIWYVRLRDSNKTSGIFDGVVKVQKILITNTEREEGMDSEEIDLISAHLLNERNPVCYGDDVRWANHLYPVYLTEKYVKSKYISGDLFLNQF